MGTTYRTGRLPTLGRSFEDQVLALTAFIEIGFEECNKNEMAFIDLTNTIWRKGLMYKVQKVTRCSKLTSLVSKMLFIRILQASVGAR